MRKILAAGLFTSFLIGVLVFFLKFLIVDALAPLYRPLILKITDDREFLVIPLALVFTLVIVFIMGLAATRIHFQTIFNKYFHKSPKNLENQMQSKWTEVQAYMKKNNLSAKNEKDWATLISYYNSL